MILTVSVLLSWSHKQYSLGSQEHLWECAEWIMTETWLLTITILTVLVWLSWYHKKYCVGSWEHLGECAAWILTERWHTHHYNTYILVWQYRLGRREQLPECAVWIMTETWHTYHYDSYGFSLALLILQATLLRQLGTPSGVCCLDYDRDIAHSPL